MTRHHAQEYDACRGAAGRTTRKSRPTLRESPTWGFLGAVPSEMSSLITENVLRQVKRENQTIDPMDLVSVQRLGEGAFARVDLCWLAPSNRLVAVKRLKAELAGSCRESIRDFVSECAMIRKLHHPHLVEFIGVGSVDVRTTETEIRSLFMVQEYVTGGTLRDLLKRSSRSMSPLYSFEEGLDICRDIASALSYLHTLSPRKILHRDLKPANILLSMNTELIGGYEVQRSAPRWKAKLADLGLAKVTAPASAIAQQQELSTRPRGVPVKMAWADKNDLTIVLQNKPGLETTLDQTGHTGSPLYMAPEVFKPQRVVEDPIPDRRAYIYNESADVFSLGLVMFEVFSRSPRSLKVRSPSQIRAHRERMAEGWRPHLPRHWPEQLRTVICDCWAHDPGKRPSASELCSRLEEMRPCVRRMDQQPIYPPVNTFLRRPQCVIC